MNKVSSNEEAVFQQCLHSPCNKGEIGSVEIKTYQYCQKKPFEGTVYIFIRVSSDDFISD